MKWIIVLITIIFLSTSSLYSQNKFTEAYYDKLTKISLNRLGDSIDDLLIVSDATRDRNEQIIIQYVNDKIMHSQTYIDWARENIILFYHTSKEARPLMVKRMKILRERVLDNAITIAKEMGFVNNRQTIYAGNEAKNNLRDAVELIDLVIIEFESSSNY
ncbi:hypothetical protein OAN38_00265 [Candidatus Marinimicrobia bacterium]|nr:hypothetical protein [Candidatus Neomarinimicrobiota bacterium]